MARPRVLITGFGPFPGVPDNPSSWLAEALAAQDTAAEPHARVLPTEWQAAMLLPQLCASLQPHVMIHFGVSQRAKTLRLERYAHNRISPRADAKGALPANSLIRSGGPDRLDTQLPVPALAAHLRQRLYPATTSHSAGNYLCNFLYYHSLEWAARNDRLALFVHIPLVNGKGPFSEAALLRAAQEILRFVLDAARISGALEALSPASAFEGKAGRSSAGRLTPVPDPPQEERGRIPFPAKG
jgi:pyroglutamyl-peptidase